ncbi:MAG: gamma-glutamyltransferase [bacterium]|nr:gamma-glutamyltransferase [bacterium]
MNRTFVICLVGVLAWTPWGIGSIALGQEAAEAEAATPAPIIEPEHLPNPASVARGDQMMVVGSDPIGVEEAYKVLESGGNAVDAAVVMGFVMAVTYPRAGNLGGGGFMLISENSHRTYALDYRERAPIDATTDLLLDDNGEPDRNKALFSHLSSGVPGTPAGLLLALSKYGTLTRQQALAPAIRLAEEGFEVDQQFHDSLIKGAIHLKRWPETARIFFKEDGEVYEVGEVFKQPDLAATLKRISLQGRAGFYQGPTAEAIAKQMKENGGLINLLDLNAYQPALRKPVRGSYRGYEVLSMPPPSSGGVHVIQILNTLEEYPIQKWGANQTETTHVMAEAMKIAYADRAWYMGDADFERVPVQRLTDERLGRVLKAKISLKKAKPSSEIAPTRFRGYEYPSTTHFSIIDKEGRAVSNTYTLNFSFGSGIVVAGTGVLMNNQMDDFTSKPGEPNAYGLIGSKANAIEPKKRMLSSMSPTILRDGRSKKVVLVTGSPGGSRIITTVVQVIENFVDHGMSLEDAVSAPRMHHQWMPDQIELEPGYNPEVVAPLQEKGHTLQPSRYWGAANSIAVDAKSGVITGVADPRRRGLAKGK